MTYRALRAAAIAVGFSGAFSSFPGDADMLMSFANVWLTVTLQVIVWLRRREVVVRKSMVNREGSVGLSAAGSCSHW